MPLKIVRNDITKMRVDAIVSPTDTDFSGSGGADGSIRRAAGPGAALKSLGLLRPGGAKLGRSGRSAMQISHPHRRPDMAGRGPGRAGDPRRLLQELPGAGEKKGLQKPCLSPYRLRGLRLSQKPGAENGCQ